MSKNADDQLARFLAVEYAHSFDDIRTMIDGANGNEALARVAIDARMSVKQIMQSVTYVPMKQTLGRIPDSHQLPLE